MKPSLSFTALMLVALIGLSGPAAADLISERGDLPIPVTEPAPKMLKYINNKENIPREFEEQPPLVPHTSENHPINLSENKCLHCHMKEPGEEEAKSVEMSESHFVDRDGNKLDHPAGSRYFCNQCHVPQVDAKPLVESTFKSAAAE